MPSANASSHHPLTPPTLAGFVDRHHFLSQLAELARACTRQPLAILWMTPGRSQAPDRKLQPAFPEALLALIAQSLRQQSGEDALWCRMSADEFVCLSCELDFDHTHPLASRLLCELQMPVGLDDQQFQPAACLGIAFLDTGENPYACLERAEQAMHTARRSVTHRIVVSGSEPLPGRMGVHLERHELALESRLYQTIEQGGLSLDYQPCVDTTGRPVSVEALLRFDSAGLATGNVIPIAEKTGLIVRLGEWAMLEAARMARRLESGGAPLPVSVNISPAQLSAPRFPQMLQAALVCANISPQQLELELSESLLLDHSRTVQSNLRAMQEAGFNFVIDDFGGRHSCLVSLKNLTASRIKLDRKFIAALPYDRRALSVVTALAQLAGEFGMQVVAKGVETRAQLDALHRSGIYVTQGYLHAPPMAQDGLQAWLQQRGNSHEQDR